VPVSSVSAALVMVVFPLSACSFWPFAHMSAIEELERRSPEEVRKSKGETFDTAFALNVLAFSLPFSTTLILTIFSVGEFFGQPLHLVSIGLLFLAICIVPLLLKKSRQAHISRKAKREVKVMEPVTQQL